MRGIVVGSPMKDEWPGVGTTTTHKKWFVWILWFCAVWKHDIIKGAVIEHCKKTYLWIEMVLKRWMGCAVCEQWFFFVLLMDWWLRSNLERFRVKVRVIIFFGKWGISKRVLLTNRHSFCPTYGLGHISMLSITSGFCCVCVNEQISLFKLILYSWNKILCLLFHTII